MSLPIQYTRVLAHAACAAPLLVLAWQMQQVSQTGDATLGADPVAEVIHRLGLWALRLLLLTLTISPLRQLTGWHRLIGYRRMLGLWAFAYVCLHLMAYVVLDLRGWWALIFEDIAKRPYITVGFIAWLSLLPLAMTSTKGWMRRLGKRWQRLHWLIYPAAILAVLHFFWRVKADTSEPLLYALVLAGLLGWRVLRWVKARATG